MSWRRLENVFSRLLRQALKISWTSLPRNNFLFSKTFSRRLVHTSSGRLGRCTQDVFKTCLIVTLKTSSRHLQDMCWKCLPEVLVTNKMFTRNESISVSIKSIFVSSKSLPSKPISEKSKANSRQIQDTLLRPQ